MDVAATEVKKRRGRKPKEPLDATNDAGKNTQKRGRKPKVMFSFDSSQTNIIMEKDNDNDNNVILKLKVNNPNNVINAMGHCKELDEPGAMHVGAYNESCFSNFSHTNADMDARYSYSSDCHVDMTTTSQNNNNVSKVGTNKVVELLKEFEEKSKVGDWPMTTSIACFWCCHRFDSPPVGLPCKYSSDGKFHVTGCFCSLECAATYNIMQIRDGHTEERINLLKMLSKHLGYNAIIKPAPPRECLTMFGGNMTIDEFRESRSKSINVNFPPMVVLVSKLEEVNDSDVSSSLKYIPIDLERVDRYKEKIKLKRNLPVNANKNTLENVMHFSVKP